MDNNENAIVIDLGVNRKNMLNESWLVSFGSAIKGILSHMFGGISIPVSVKGTPSEIRAFAKALERERRFIDAFSKYGLDDPKTHQFKHRLKDAVGNFEEATGLQWPFK